MELNNLKYLESIYRLRSFTKAAAEHYISQPSISMAIQKLETELNTSLINRNEKPLQFTSEGEHFMLHVYNILNAVDDAITDMKQLSADTKKVINLAWASTVGDIIRPTLFTDFYDQHPNYQIMLVEQTSEQILEQLKNGTLDAAYVNIPERYNPDLFEIIPIQMCEMFVCMSHDHPMATCSELSLEEIKDETIVTFPAGSLLRRRIENKFKEMHIVPRLHTVSPVSIIENLVKDNYGLTLLPIDEINTPLHDDRLTAIPLTQPINFVKGFILRRGEQRTAPVNDLISYVEDFVHVSKNKFRTET